MSDLTGPTPEAYEAALAKLNGHRIVADIGRSTAQGVARPEAWTCSCGASGEGNPLAHLSDVAVRGAWPLAVAEGRRQEHVESVEYDKGYLAGFTEGRAIAAADIRARVADVITRAEVLAEVPQGSGGDHPAAMAMELAARIAEGTTDV